MPNPFDVETMSSSGLQLFAAFERYNGWKAKGRESKIEMRILDCGQNNIEKREVHPIRRESIGPNFIR